MIHIHTVREKVSREEKQEVLDNPNINVGMEFEIESAEPVITAEEDSELPLVTSDSPGLDQFIDAYRQRFKDIVSRVPRVELWPESTEYMEDEYAEAILSYEASMGETVRSELKEAIKEITDMESPLIRSIIVPTEHLLLYEGNEYDFDIDTRYDSMDPDLLTTTLERDGVRLYLVVVEEDNQFSEALFQFNYPEVDTLEQVNGTPPAGDISEFEDRVRISIKELISRFSRKIVVVGDSPIINDLGNVIGDDIKVFRDYHGGENYPGWRIEPDSSLATSGGFELITPRGGLPLKEALSVAREVFNYIDKTDGLYTSLKTGFHINISIDGVDLRKDLDPLKLALFMEEGKVFKYFQTRKNNKYTMSVLKALRNPEKSRDFSGMKDKEYSEIVSDIKDKLVPVEKYFGINLEKLSKNYIEFRYIGGPDYHKKYGIIRRQILDYAFFLLVATNPEFKRREYIKKVNRLINDIEDEIEAKKAVKDLEDKIGIEAHALRNRSPMSAPIDYTEQANIFVRVARRAKKQDIFDTTKILNSLKAYLEAYIEAVLVDYEMRRLSREDAVENLREFAKRVFTNDGFPDFKEWWRKSLLRENIDSVFNVPIKDLMG